LRIIGGIHKGKRIQVSKSFKARPTTDFAKENIFNVIENHFSISEIEVLDLFAGTGSISYEFCSREAIKVDAVEMNSRSVHQIKNFSDELSFSQLQVHRADVFRFLPKLNKQFDIIFADPPFQLKTLTQIPQLVIENKLLREGGWLILEHGENHSFNQVNGYKKVKRYGSVHFSIFSLD
jgi:16S rRNA (guanine966-N2)-methyltransferase